MIKRFLFLGVLVLSVLLVSAPAQAAKKGKKNTRSRRAAVQSNRASKPAPKRIAPAKPVNFYPEGAEIEVLGDKLKCEAVSRKEGKYPAQFCESSDGKTELFLQECAGNVLARELFDVQSSGEQLKEQFVDRTRQCPNAPEYVHFRKGLVSDKYENSNFMTEQMMKTFADGSGYLSINRYYDPAAPENKDLPKDQITQFDARPFAPGNDFEKFCNMQMP